jgi:hypothetical protein
LTGNINLSLYNSIEKVALLPEKTTDIVLILDVIEHIENDAGFLISLAKNKHISKDTVFIITAPAFSCLFSSHDTFLKHYKRYSLKDLNRLLNKSNLKSLKSGYFFFVLLFPRVMKLLIGKMKPGKSMDKGIGQWNQGLVVSWFLTGVLMIDYLICSLFLAAGIAIPGLSVYSVCKTTV